MGGRGASIKINSRLKSFSMSIKIPVLVEKSKTISQENISNRKSRKKYLKNILDIDMLLMFLMKLQMHTLIKQEKL